jgi:hypothetical protein
MKDESQLSTEIRTSSAKVLIAVSGETARVYYPFGPETG